MVARIVGSVPCFIVNDDKSGLEHSDYDIVLQNINRQWMTIMDSSLWWSASQSLTADRNENEKAATVVTSLKNLSIQKPSKLTDGFFSKCDRRHPKDKITSVTGRRHVINRPKDIGDGKNTATVRDSVPTTTTTISSDMAIFSTENECMSANNGRLCVCFMIDYLDSIGDRLDEVAAENQTVVATAFRCTFYKLVSALFVVSPTKNTTITPIDKTTVNVLGRNDLTNGIYNKTANVTVRREVDFNHVVNYELETSKNSKLTSHDLFGRR